MTKISEAPELLASGVTIPTAVKVALADNQGTAAGKRMTLRELHKTVTVTYVQSAVPAPGSATGFYSVQTGALYRGLYFSAGTSALIQIVSYPADQPWPVT